ncbi:hypothetical protein BHM03_00029651, partial [Ensete ventricosum]
MVVRFEDRVLVISPLSGLRRGVARTAAGAPWRGQIEPFYLRVDLRLGRVGVSVPVL